MAESKKGEKTPKVKAKYNLWQMCGYMIALAVKYHPMVLVICVVTALLAVAGNVLGLFITPTVIQAVEDRVDLNELLLIIGLFVGGLLVISSLSSYVSANTIFGRLSLRKRLFEFVSQKNARTSYPNIEDEAFQKKYAEANRCLNGNMSAGENVWATITTILQNIGGFVVYVLIIATFELWIVGVVLLTTVASYIIATRLDLYWQHNREEYSKLWGKFYYISNAGSGANLAKDIRIFGMRPWIMDIINTTMRSLISFRARGQKKRFLGDVADAVLTLARNGIAYVYLIHMVISQNMSIVQFLLLFTAIGGMAEWVSGILRGFEELGRETKDLSALREFVEYPEQFKFEDGEALEPIKGAKYELEMRNVSFRYPGSEKNVLKNVDLKIAGGEKLAIVGLNGAGKSTLVKLLCGLYDPTEGEILLNGQNIKKYNRRDLYRHFSAVFQDFSILAVSIEENIVQSMDLDEAKIAHVIEMAGLTEKINSLPNKTKTNVTKEVYEDGIKLSGGETQRLMLARALYKGAPIMILDEPTAALDPIAEADLYNKYNEFSEGATSLYISHRLASTRFCDRIVLLDEGGIIEEGTHESLLAAGKKYAELFEIQSHYYKAEVA